MVEPLTSGIIGMAVLFALIAIGAPVSIGLLVGGMTGLLLIGGVSGPFVMIGELPNTIFQNLSFVAIPLFVLMGNILAYHDIGKDLYSVVYKWLGWLPGGLAIVSTTMSALFGFMCGSGLAGTATIGSVALPEMEKRGYNRRLACGTLALAGGLATLIPPSVTMIIYSLLSGASMGRLFFAGIGPGFLLAGLMCVYILTRASFQKSLAPPAEERFPIGVRLKSLVHMIPVFILFVTVLGGIYMGVWSPVEASGGGCLIALLICLAYRRVTVARLKKSLIQATGIAVMIYALVIGAWVLSFMFYVSGLSKVIEQALLSLAIPRWGIVLIILAIMMIMGMFMEIMGMLMIMIPITLPIILALGYDIIWWGIIMIVSTEMALITPPVGFHLFVIKGIASKGTTLTDVALGAAPFVGVLWVLIVLMIMFPEIALWLPATMRGG